MHSLIAEVEAVARRDGDRAHSIQGETVLSFSDFVRATHRVAHALRRSGIGPGDRVAVWSRNDFRMLQAIYGAMRCKALFIPLNARNSVAENTSLLRRFECQALFVQEGIVDPAAMIEEIPSLHCVIPFITTSSSEIAFDEWSAAASEDGLYPDEFVSGDDPAAIFPTSGTTGEPKGVVHTHFGLATMARGYREVLGLADGGSHLVVAPVTHVAGGLVYATSGQGYTQVFVNSTQPAAILNAIQNVRASLLFVPPTLLYGMLDEHAERPRDLTSLQTVMYAGSPISPARLQQATELLGPVLVNVYSQSEVLYPITSLSRDDHARIGRGEQHLLTSAGKPTPVGQVSIMSDGGRHLGPGEVGEIVTRSLAGMKEFINDAVATQTLRAYGWHHTGDVGKVDEQGFLYLVDRKKDMIISGGFNVYSAEVELVLQDHPAVAEVAVIGRPDPKWGEAVCAVIVPRDGHVIDPSQVKDFCKDRLGSVKSPKLIEIRDSLPRNSAGKVLKRKLRELLDGVA